MSTTTAAQVPVLYARTFPEVRALEADLATLGRTAVLVAPPMAWNDVGRRYGAYFHGQRLPGPRWCEPGWPSLYAAQLALAEAFALAIAVDGRRN